MVVPRGDVPRALTASRARLDKEAASRAAFQQGELGLDRYGLRDRLPDFGIEYVTYEEYSAAGAVTYDDTGVRCTMLRGGTSRGLYFEAQDLPADAAARDDLLLRLMGTPDPRQIDGLGGATTLTSKVAVVSPSDDPEVDVDYLFLQLGVDEATVSELQNCGNILAGVGPFAVERGLVPAGGPRDQRADPHGQLRQHRRRHLPDPRRTGRVPRRRRDRRRPGHGRPRRPRLRRHRGLGHRRAAADRARPRHDRGHRGHLRRQRHAGRPGPRRVVRADRLRAARAARRGHGAARAGRRLPPQGRPAHGPGRRLPRLGAQDGAARRCPPTAGRSAPGRSSRCSRTPRSACSARSASSPGCCSPAPSDTSSPRTGRRGPRRSTSSTRPATCWSTSSSTPRVTPPRVVRSGVVRTARKLFDGTAFPRA